MIRGRYFFLGGVCLFVASVFLFLHSSTPTKDAPRPVQLFRQVVSLVSSSDSSDGYNMSDFSVALMSHSSNQLIYLASVDSSYLPMALNLYETSFKKLGIRNYLYACSDTEAHEALQKRGINSFDFMHDKDSKRASAYGSKEFRRKTHMKTKVILDALNIGLTVIIIDVDIVLFKDPVPYLDCKDCDIQIQSDVSEGNSGFYMSRPTEPSIKLHEKAWEIAETKGESISNQKALDRNMESMSRRKQLKMKTLSMSLFPPGKYYFEDKKRMFYTDNPPKNEVLVHNNWIVSKAAKIYRFKEQLQWMVDTDGYYTSPTRRYLTYDNTVPSVTTEKEALKTALLIGNLLNRTVILPTFTCKSCNYGACKVPSGKCSFNTHFKITTFDKFYEHRYREHVFLQHPLVPATTRKETDTFLISTVPDKKSKAHTVLQPKDMKGPVEAEILQWFSHIETPVLRFTSLDGIYANFKDKSYVKDEAFNTKTDYRQY